MSFDEPARQGGAFKVGFVAALALECGSLRRQLPGAPTWLVFQSGPGAARAAQAAERAVDGGARVLVSWGLAGGLDAALAPGTVVLPRRVLNHGVPPLAVDEHWHLRLAALADELALQCGDLLTATAALESPSAKRAAAAESRAVAVDMESSAIAVAAARARVPFVALRVVVDALDDTLPPHAERWIDEQGRRRFAPALCAAASPRQWRALLALASRYRVASGVLERLARALARRRIFAAEGAALQAGG
jgi:adenosylhomocysteine nucleosidase